MHSNGKPRRRHSKEFKQQVIAACAQPGASVAAGARSFELNDNLVHQWRRGREWSIQRAVEAVPGFVALSLPALAPGRALGSSSVRDGSMTCTYLVSSSNDNDQQLALTWLGLVTWACLQTWP